MFLFNLDSLLNCDQQLYDLFNILFINHLLYSENITIMDLFSKIISDMYHIYIIY